MVNSKRILHLNLTNSLTNNKTKHSHKPDKIIGRFSPFCVIIAHPRAYTRAHAHAHPFRVVCSALSVTVKARLNFDQNTINHQPNLNLCRPFARLKLPFNA